MFKTERLTIDISFSIPEWFPPDRLDYKKSYYYPKDHAFAGSYDHSKYYNSAEENLFNRFNKEGIKEICNHHWIEFEYDGYPVLLPNWIEKITNRLDKFFNQYKEAKE